jgi:(2Fe-2S) ferredoxin
MPAAMFVTLKVVEILTHQTAASVPISRRRGKIKLMARKKIIEDRDQLERLAPMLQAPIKRQVFVCTGKSCSAVGGQEVMAEFSRILTEKGLRQGKESKGRNPMGEVVLTECGSIGFCSIGTAVMVYPDGTMYGQVTPADAAEIVEEHLEKGKVVERLALMELGQNRER